MMEKPSQKGFSLVGLAEKLVAFLAKIAGYGAFIAILSAMLAIVYEVIARYLFSWPTAWEIEAAIFLLIFATFIGSVHALQDDAHVSMDMIAAMIRPRIKAKLNAATSLASLSFCILVSIKGWGMWWEAYSLDWHSDSIWAPPLWIPYIFLPIGFTVMALQYLVIFLKQIVSVRDRGSKP
jgi:TRAP-type C4-dicarboxylate transport system permease small subunit